MSTNQRKRFRVDDLFTDTRPQAVGVDDLVTAKEIQLERIVPDPNQPRRQFDEAALGELAASIRTEGVLQPIAVRYDEAHDRYIIIHGERRWRASRLAGLQSIPAVVREVDPERILLQQLMENIVREDLNAIDRAAALRALKTQMGDAPWEQVAEAVGIRRSRLFQLLGTEKLSPRFQEALRAGQISEKQTRSVQRLDEDIQEELGQHLQAGEFQPADLDRIARSLRGGDSYEEALVKATAGPDSKVSPKASTTSGTGNVRKQVRELHRALDGYPEDAPDDLRADLAALVERIQALIGD